MEIKPKISVIMPVGRVNHLQSSLDSINAQTCRDFELIIICDSDIYLEISQIIEQPRFDFPRKIIPTRLSGFTFAVNLGISHARAEFIARWDADDLCDANRFQRQLEEFVEHPDLVVLGTRAMLIDGNGIPIYPQKFKYYRTDTQIRRALKYRQPLLHSAVMFRASILFANKGYRYGYTSEDHELYIRIARDKSVKFGNLPDVLSYYRRYPEQLTSSAKEYDQFCDIGGFMWAEFLRSGNPLYVVGMLANLPLARWARRVMRGGRNPGSHNATNSSYRSEPSKEGDIGAVRKFLNNIRRIC